MIDCQRIYAISDLHLPGGDEKAMSVFGEQWTGHFDKISRDWNLRVRSNDIVLIPGDISWAMKLDDALPDLLAIGCLPGIKIIIKGNHDFWWNAIGQVRRSLPRSIIAIQNDAVFEGGKLFCGSRGWLNNSPEDDNNRKIYDRELARMEMSLQQAKRLSDTADITFLTHFPPCDDICSENQVTLLLQRYNVRDVVYGHLHGVSIKHAYQGEKGGIRYHFVSCDHLRFSLYQLPVIC